MTQATHEAPPLPASVLADVERDDPAAACERALAHPGFPHAAKGLSDLPTKAVRRLAQHCVELYREAAATPERRNAVLTLHTALLGCRLDFLEEDHLEIEVLVAASSRDIADACETALAAGNPRRTAERLRGLHEWQRHRLTDALAELHGAAQTSERRNSVLWLHTALSHYQLNLLRFEDLEPVVREVLGRDGSAEVEAVLASDSFLRVMSGLRALPPEVRERLAGEARSLREGARTPERTELTLWLEAALLFPPLPGGLTLSDEFEAMWREVLPVDAAAACEMVLADKEFGGARLLPTLPGDLRDRLAQVCVELYGATDSWARRDRIARMHAMLAPGRPDDLMAHTRQEALSAATAATFWGQGCVHMVWVELVSGRDVPVSFGRTLRRYWGEGYGSDVPLGEVVRLLTAHPVLNAGDEWTDHALAELADLPDAWRDLVAHAATAKASRPSATWERRGRALLAGVDADEFRERVLGWLALVGEPRSLPLENDVRHDRFNDIAVRGLVRLLSFLPGHAHTASGLGALLEKALVRVPGQGPDRPALANACATALGRIGDGTSHAELVRLAAVVDHRPTLKLIGAGLDAHTGAV
ncbi:hypothetical protein GCM10009551_013120 [Nocardiopsis tropica]|uniref:hypothetical protein n=1 Tax=Nocardiopsis tropica TaxID=109330 RepID=UPI0031E33F14